MEMMSGLFYKKHVPGFKNNLDGFLTDADIPITFSYN